MKYLIRVGQLIDGFSATPKGPHWVAIDGERFAWVRPVSDDALSEDFEGVPVIEADDLIMLPGLIDAHVHISNNSEPGRDRFHLTDLPGAATLRCLRNAERSLDMGFTALRDCAGMGVLSLRDASNRGEFTTPRLFAAGYGICATAGHMDRDRLPGVRAVENPGVGDSPAEVRRIARSLLKLGVDFIKVNATRGFGGIIRGSQEMTTEELRAAVEVAHMAGKRVASHAMGTAGIQASLDAGVDSIEHGFWLTEAQAEQMVEQGTYLLPTAATLFRNVTRGFDREGMSEAALQNMHELASSAREAMFRSLEIAQKAGVAIACGSDMGGGPFLYHGENSTELEQLVESGLSEMEAIHSATSIAASLLDRGQDLGRVAADYLADFILVRDNPLDDIHRLSDPVNFGAVVLGGKVVRMSEELLPRASAILEGHV